MAVEEPEETVQDGRHDSPDDSEVKLKLAIYLLYKLLTAIKGDGLKECHRIEVPFAVHTQKDQAKDLRLIFTDRIKVKFILKDTSVEELTGRWCNICK